MVRSMLGLQPINRFDVLQAFLRFDPLEPVIHGMPIFLCHRRQTRRRSFDSLHPIDIDLEANMEDRKQMANERVSICFDSYGVINHHTGWRKNSEKTFAFKRVYQTCRS